MKQSTPRLLIYTALGSVLLLFTFLYVILSLNFGFNHFQKNAELTYNKSRIVLTDIRAEMVTMGKYQNSYLIFPNTTDSLGYVTSGQATKKSLSILFTYCQDSLLNCSEITQLNTLLNNNLTLFANTLHANVLYKISGKNIHILKEKIDLLRDNFYAQLDKILSNSRNRYQRLHDYKDEIYQEKIELLIFGTVCLILLIIFLVYRIYQQINRKIQLQKRYQIFENAGDGLLVTDADFRIIYTNQKTAELLKKDYEEMEGDFLWEQIPSLASQVISEKIYLSFNQQESQFIEVYHELVATWFRIGIYPFTSGLSLTIKDINELKKVEFELHKSRKLYEFISKANDLILHANSADEIYPAFCQLAVESEDFLFAWVGKADESGEYIQPFISAGNHSDYIKKLVIAIKDVPEAHGPSGRAFRTGKFYYCNDITRDPLMIPWRDSALSHGFRSSIALPIRIEDSVNAVITLYAAEPFYFKDDQLKLMVRVMDNISFALTALESIRKRQEAEQRLQIVNQAIEQSHASVVITNVKGEIQYVNPAFTQLTGYTMEEVIGENPRVLKTGHTSDTAYTNLWKEISEGRIWQGEFLNKKKNGETYWESATISPIQTNEGTISHYVAVKENITERKKLETEQQQLLRMIENTSAFMGTCDMNRNLIYGNQSLKDVLEIGNEDITQYKIDDFRMAEDMKFMQEIYDALSAKGKWLGENKYVSKSGKLIPVMQVIMLHLDFQGNPDYISTTAIDLTKMKEAEKELVRLNNELRNFTSHLQYIRETEKNTITKIIHDELGQGLASIKMDAAWIKKHLDDGRAVIDAKLDILLDSISEKLNAFNKIYLSANTRMIDEIGLVASLQYQADLFTKNHQIPVSFHSNIDQLWIQTDQGVNIYRILLEGLSNIYHHAHATKVTIELLLINENLILTIQDNGRGFDYNSVNSQKHHGLIDIRERVLSLNGKLFINSQPNEGTTLTVQVLINKRSV